MSEERSLYDRLGGHEGILKLIRPFYMDVRQHALLGPIFNAQVKDWSAHLANITDFWALQTGGKSRYRGGFARAHMGLGLQQEHFDHWLGLWQLNNARELAQPEATEMNNLAHQLAGRLFAVTRDR